jgi:molybdopterin molybdotransferase
MISFEEARRIVLGHAKPLKVTRTPLTNLTKRFLAEPLIAPFDVPRFDNSAVDGYGVKIADLSHVTPEQPATLRVNGTIRAGDVPRGDVSRGTCVKLLTGAVVPSSVEAVVMKEFTTQDAEAVKIARPVVRGENIRRVGAEFRIGQEILAKGTRVTPPVLGLLASFGFDEFPVHDTPKIALIVTGNELVQTGEQLTEGKIYDSISPALNAACRQLGIGEVSVMHARDDENEIAQSIARAMTVADVVITVGGASVGDFDYVKPALQAVGATIHFSQVAMKPGKPNVFATMDGKSKLIFGLPGNPVSALVSFHVLVKPALLTMMGASDVAPKMFRARLGVPIRKSGGRLEFVRATLNVNDHELVAVPVSGQESHMLGGLAMADCLIHFPIESESLTERDYVCVEMLSWE